MVLLMNSVRGPDYKMRVSGACLGKKLSGDVLPTTQSGIAPLVDGRSAIAEPCRSVAAGTESLTARRGLLDAALKS
jgi:hypothetical protein